MIVEAGYQKTGMLYCMCSVVCHCKRAQLITHHTIKIHWGGGGVEVYTWGKSPWYPLHGKPGGPQSWSGCYGGGKQGIKPRLFSHPASSVVAIPTELSWFWLSMCVWKSNVMSTLRQLQFKGMLMGVTLASFHACWWQSLITDGMSCCRLNLNIVLFSRNFQLIACAQAVGGEHTRHLLILDLKKI
jgi:hypothetical protein